MKKNMEKIKSGGVYCSQCKKCLAPPRRRKEFRPESFILCDDCDINILRITFRPRYESLLTDFKVKYEDIEGLIHTLTKVWHKLKSKGSS